MKSYSFVLFKSLNRTYSFALFVLFALHLPIRAVTLQQKWVPGQQLGYDATVNGTLTLLDDDESPQPWAGLPIDFKVRGNGALTLDTLSVDEAGIGTVVLRSGDSQIRAMGFGQVMEFHIKDGLAKALMNGKPAGESVLTNRSFLDPNFALRLGPQGNLESVVTLRKEEKPAGDLPFDFMGALQGWVLRAVPTLWPQGEIKEGDKWTAPLAIPLPPKNKTEEPPAPLSAGQVTFTLRGIEETGGRKAHRIALDGSFDVDAAKAKLLNESARELEKQAPKSLPQNAAQKNATNKDKKPLTSSTTRNLADARQKISGNLWLDTTNGQLVRAELTAKGRLHTQGTITNRAGRTRPTETWADWDGSLQLQLRRVSNISVTK